MASHWITTSEATSGESMTITLGESFVYMSDAGRKAITELLDAELRKKLEKPRPPATRTVSYDNLTVLGVVDLTDRLSSVNFRRTFSGELPGQLTLVSVLSDGGVDLAVVYESGVENLVTTVMGANFGGFDLDSNELIPLQREGHRVPRGND